MMGRGKAGRAGVMGRGEAGRAGVIGRGKAGRAGEMGTMFGRYSSLGFCVCFRFMCFRSFAAVFSNLLCFLHVPNWQ